MINIQGSAHLKVENKIYNYCRFNVPWGSPLVQPTANKIWHRLDKEVDKL